MEKVATAKYKYTGQSAQKVRLVANMVKGMNVNDALSILKFTNKTAAKVVYKVLHSVYSNAVNTKEMDKKKLTITKITVDEAPTQKRFRIASRHGYREILKRSSHIMVEVKE